MLNDLELVLAPFDEIVCEDVYVVKTDPKDISSLLNTLKTKIPLILTHLKRVKRENEDNLVLLFKCCDIDKFNEILVELKIDPSQLLIRSVSMKIPQRKIDYEKYHTIWPFAKYMTMIDIENEEYVSRMSEKEVSIISSNILECWKRTLNLVRSAILTIA